METPSAVNNEVKKSIPHMRELFSIDFMSQIGIKFTEKGFFKSVANHSKQVANEFLITVVIRIFII